MNQQRKWKTIKDFPRYQISNDGLVRTDYLCGSKKGTVGEYRYLARTKNNNGYLCVQLYNKTKRKKIYIHQLVATYFLNQKPNQCVNHKDGNKLNNSIDNLEWCTYRDNSKHAYATGLNKLPHQWRELKK